MEYRSKYTGAEVDALLDKVENGEVGGKVTVDSVLSTESENPVMNKVITAELGKKATKTELSALETKVTETDEKLVELSQGKEDKTNKVTSLTEESTDVQYPSAKAVYALSERISENEILIEDLQNTKIDKEADDYYPQLAVGLADNLAGVDVVDSEVNFRRSGGGAISDGVARIESIKGNSVVWNQIFGRGATNKDYLKWEDNVATINGEFDADNQTFDITTSGARFVAPIIGHKYLIEIDVVSGTLNGTIYHYINPIGKGYNITSDSKSLQLIETASSTSYWYARTIKANTTCVDTKVRFRITDLTKMFGAGNEPTTIEEFYARIPMGVDLNAYNEGEVIHMDVQSIESQGVNAWDEEWELGSLSVNTGQNLGVSNRIRTKNYIRVIGGESYSTKLGAIASGESLGIVCYYDDNKKFIETRYPTVEMPFVVPSNARYMRVGFYLSYGSTYKNDICINISDTSINGKYFPYIKRVEDLSIIRKYFPNGMKSAGSAHDEIRYNKVTQKWEMVQRIGEVDLGTLSWRLGSGRMIASANFASASHSANTKVGNILTQKYMTLPYNNDSQPSVYTGSLGIAILKDGGDYYFSVYDSSYTDAATFKAAMQGVMLYYELAEPIVTELDAEDQFKDLDYQVWNCGTEKAIAEGKSAPLAADITYGFNAIGKIKELESLVAALRAKVGI